MKSLPTIIIVATLVWEVETISLEFTSRLATKYEKYLVYKVH